MHKNDIPIVLTVAGHDATHGAGIIADTEAIRSTGAYAVSIISCLTLQNTHNIKELEPVSAAFFRRQLADLSKDFNLSAIKIGLIGSIENALVLADFLSSFQHIPIVLDPVLAAGGGKEVTKQVLVEVIRERLLPLVQLVTPNSVEARQLSQQNNLAAAAKDILALGCKACLITGSHEQTETIIHQLHQSDQPIKYFEAQRLGHEYHGSGCTLASAITAQLAWQYSLETSIEHAQAFTWKSLDEAFQLTDGQALPNRYIQS